MANQTNIELLELIDPRGESAKAERQLPLSPRPTDLTGKVIGLLDNQKWNVGPFLDDLEALIKEKYQVRAFIRRQTNFASPAPEEVINDLVERCDVVVNAVGD